VKCQGCGICAAACPAKAIQLGHFRDEEVLAMLDAFGARACDAPASRPAAPERTCAPGAPGTRE